MIIKKYQAKTEEEAMELARKELGEEVTLIHSRNVKPKGLFSFLRKMQVEVTVAKEEEMDRPEVKAREALQKVDQLRQKTDSSPKSAPEPAKKEDEAKSSAALMAEAAVEEKLESIQNLLERKLSSQAEEEKEKREQREEVRKEEDRKQKELVDFCKMLYKTLVDNEVSERNANELVDEIGKNNSAGVQIEHVLSDIYQKIILKFGKPQCIEPAAKGPKVIFFIGPTGVGKTTTLAKLASRFRLIENKKIALFTTDTYRISATDQLKTYAGILGAPVHVIYSPDELKENYERYKEFDYILVDTAGHSHKNEEQKKEMARFLDTMSELAECEFYLVLSATTKYRDLISIADAYRELAGYRLIFTKLDETREMGNLLNLRLHTMAPVSYVTNGQNVPDDIEVFNPQAMAKDLLTDHTV